MLGADERHAPVPDHARLRANLCADGHTGVRLPAFSAASLGWLVASRGYRASEAVHPRLQGLRGSERNLVASFSRSLLTVAPDSRCTRNSSAFTTGGEQTLRAC